MEKAPAFQWYPKDYLSDPNVQMMTLEQEGIYIRLMSYCWDQGSIPEDMQSLKMLCKNMADGTAIAQVLLCFEKTPDGYVHPRLEKERIKQEKFRKGKSDAGKKGAKSRWGNKLGKDGTANGSAMAQPMAKNGSSSASASSSSSADNSPLKSPPGDVDGMEVYGLEGTPHTPDDDFNPQTTGMMLHDLWRKADLKPSGLSEFQTAANMLHKAIGNGSFKGFSTFPDESVIRLGLSRYRASLEVLKYCAKPTKVIGDGLFLEFIKDWDAVEAPFELVIEDIKAGRITKAVNRKGEEFEVTHDGNGALLVWNDRRAGFKRGKIEKKNIKNWTFK